MKNINYLRISNYFLCKGCLHDDDVDDDGKRMNDISAMDMKFIGTFNV